MAPGSVELGLLAANARSVATRTASGKSVADGGALWLSCDGEPERLSYRSLADAHFNNVAVASFLNELMSQTDKPITSCGTEGNMHRAVQFATC